MSSMVGTGRAHSICFTRVKAVVIASLPAVSGLPMSTRIQTVFYLQMLEKGNNILLFITAIATYRAVSHVLTFIPAENTL